MLPPAFLYVQLCFYSGAGFQLFPVGFQCLVPLVAGPVLFPLCFFVAVGVYPDQPEPIGDGTFPTTLPDHIQPKGVGHGGQLGISGRQRLAVSPQLFCNFFAVCNDPGGTLVIPPDAIPRQTVRPDQIATDPDICLLGNAAIAAKKVLPVYAHCEASCPGRLPA